MLSNYLTRLALATMLWNVQHAAHADEFVVVLSHEYVGPAMKVQTVRMKENGEITNELYDITAESKSGSFKTVHRCQMSAREVASTVSTAAALLNHLPETIDANKPIPIDGPSKSIAVTKGGVARRSSWSSESFTETSAPMSKESRDFAHAWEKISSLVGCDANNGRP